MNTLDVISSRRSIRRFTGDPVPDEALRTILTAATQAPSGKNRQPWRFVVVTGDRRSDMVRVMRAGIQTMQDRGIDTGSAVPSAQIMEQAPVTVFVFNPGGMHPWEPREVRQSFSNIVDVQSIGAAIQNMLLAAHEIGIGSLWICDVFFAYDELREWLGEPGQLTAAVSFGYQAEHPQARPRRSVGDVTRWL